MIVQLTRIENLCKSLTQINCKMIINDLLDLERIIVNPFLSYV